MNEPKKTVKAEPEALKTIEELQRIHGISRPVMEGMKSLYGWRAGYQTSEREFLKARDSFLKAPAGGGKESRK